MIRTQRWLCVLFFIRETIRTFQVENGRFPVSSRCTRNFSSANNGVIACLFFYPSRFAHSSILTSPSKLSSSFACLCHAISPRSSLYIKTWSYLYFCICSDRPYFRSSSSCFSTILHKYHKFAILQDNRTNINYFHTIQYTDIVVHFCYDTDVIGA